MAMSQMTTTYRVGDAEITRIVERNRKPYVGIAEVGAHQIFVKADSRRMPMDIYLPKRDCPDVRDGEKVVGLNVTDRTTDESRTIDLDGIFVQIGLLPNTEWLDGTVALSDRKEVEIDDHGRTSVPSVFAAGDCTTVPFKQIVIALGAGATASLSAFDHLIRTSTATTTAAAAAAPA